LPVNTGNASNGTGKVLEAGISCKSWTGKKLVGATKQEPLPCGEQIARSNVSLQLLKKPL